VFTRFSTVLGSRGSADTVRDTRGFAVKFYTDEGVFDLVGNNIPVFFIQDGIKFPDIIHAGKPHPDREIPQAQSAHDTFWDFVSLHTEATHHVFWNMSDRGIPRSYRTMEGFGVHTFRLVNSEGKTSLAKFHWKPVAGVHSLVWEEAQIAAGVDPDFHRRDMADGIEAGAFLEYELGIQIMPDDGTDSFEGIDLLDPTKLVPEELAPVQMIGKLTLNRNPTNYFAETEQVAFHTGNLVPGIEVTNDPLMQARLFSYLDTQLTRLGGPNFTQLPINRPHCPVNDMLRDGMHQSAIHTGLAPYRPNSIDNGEPNPAGTAESGYVPTPRVIEGTAVRAQPVSFDDHFSQATMFYRSLTPIEQAHLAEAFTFELGKVYEQAIKERELAVLANVDADLCRQVAAGLGLPAPQGEPAPDVVLSPALSQIVTEPGPVDGRKIGVVADTGSDLAGVTALVKAIAALGATALVIAPAGGVLKAGRRKVTVDRTFATARSIEFDAVVVAGGTTSGADLRLVVLLQEAFRHCKALAAWGDGTAVLKAARIPVKGPGVEIAEAADKAFVTALADAVGLHRAWDRAPKVMASAVPPVS
jgi:catalase